MLSQDLTAVLQHAVDDTRARRHEQLTVEHLLLAIVLHPASARILHACSVDLAALQGELERHLGNRPGTQTVEVPRQTVEFERTLQEAAMHVQAAGRDELSVGNVVVALLAEHDTYAAFLLVRAGLTRLALLTYLAHGAMPLEGPSPLPRARLLGNWRPRQASAAVGQYCIMLHDDDYTTREFVIELLTTVFEQSAAEATELMETVQLRGTGTVGPFSLQTATELLDEAIRRAHDGEFPLKLTIVPAPA